MKNVQHCENLAQVREHIDALDMQLVPLLAERSGYVAQAARLKQSTDQIVDVARIESIVQRVRAMAEELGASPKLMEALYRSMITAFIEFEREEFARLRPNL